MIAPVVAGMVCGGAAGVWAGLIYGPVGAGIGLGLIGGALSGLLWARTFTFALVRRLGAEKKSEDLGGKIGMLVGWLCTIVLHVALWLVSGYGSKDVVVIAMFVGAIAGGFGGGFVGRLYSPHAGRIREGRASQLAPPLPPGARIPWLSPPFAMAAALLGAWGMVAGSALGRIAFLDKATLFPQHGSPAESLELVGAATGLAAAAVEFLLMAGRARRRIRTGRLASCGLEVEALLLAVPTIMLGGVAAFGLGMRAQGWWNSDALIVCMGWTLAAALCTGIFWGTAIQWSAEATARRLSTPLAPPPAAGLDEDRVP
jgi:hypothetical protein